MKLCFAIVLGVLGVIFVLSLLLIRHPQCAKNQHPSNILRQAAQWHIMAEQDSNPLIALLHVNYAIASANIAKQLGIGSRNVDVNEFISHLQKTQQARMQQVSQSCPALKLDGMFAVASGWI